MSDISPEDAYVQSLIQSWLSETTLTSEDLRNRGVDPDTPGLMHFTGPGGQERFFAWQLDSENKPYELLQHMNEILDYEGDPLGIIDWWMSSPDGRGDKIRRDRFLEEWRHNPPAGLRHAWEYAGS